MHSLILAATVLLLALVGYTLGRSRSRSLAGASGQPLHSLPAYYGGYVAIWCGLPAVLVMAVWLGTEGAIVRALTVQSLPAELVSDDPDRMALLLTDIRNLAAGSIVSRNVDPALQAAADHYHSLRQTGFASMAVVVLACAVAGLVWARRRVVPGLRARNHVERVILWVLIACSTIAILTTIGIVLSLIFETLRFFEKVPLHEFLFGMHWSPQTAIRSDQVGASGAFGAIPLFAGTLLITLIAMLVAGPIGLMSAIYMAEYAGSRLRSTAKPVLEVLAGIPTVVYGFFAALTVAPFVRQSGGSIGLDVASESALAAGVVMGIMIIPFVSSLSDDVINAVPQSLRDASYGLGATRSETIRQVILPAALPGIVGAFMLAISRAIGETMIVVMAAGLAANLTANPLEAVTTVTVQIVTLLVGDQEFDSAKTLAAFALGLMLFVVTLGLNLLALSVVRKYRERYD